MARAATNPRSTGSGAHGTARRITNTVLVSADHRRIDYLPVCGAQGRGREGQRCGGWWSVLLGALFYAVGYRTLQPRVTMGALPFLLWGGAWYLWGWRVARMLVFPLFFFWLAIPLPSFQQATTQLQLLATSMAHHGAALFGVETIVQGTAISSAHGAWDPLGNRQGLQRHPLVDGLADDFRRVGLHRENGVVETRGVVSIRLSAGHPWQRAARDLDFRDRRIWRRQMGAEYVARLVGPAVVLSDFADVAAGHPLAAGRRAAMEESEPQTTPAGGGHPAGRRE